MQTLTPTPTEMEREQSAVEQQLRKMDLTTDKSWALAGNIISAAVRADLGNSDLKIYWVSLYAAFRFLRWSYIISKDYEPILRGETRLNAWFNIIIRYRSKDKTLKYRTCVWTYDPRLYDMPNPHYLDQWAQGIQYDLVNDARLLLCDVKQLPVPYKREHRNEQTIKLPELLQDFKFEIERDMDKMLTGLEPGTTSMTARSGFTREFLKGAFVETQEEIEEIHEEAAQCDEEEAEFVEEMDSLFGSSSPNLSCLSPCPPPHLSSSDMTMRPRTLSITETQNEGEAGNEVQQLQIPSRQNTLNDSQMPEEPKAKNTPKKLTAKEKREQEQRTKEEREKEREELSKADTHRTNKGQTWKVEPVENIVGDVGRPTTNWDDHINRFPEAPEFLDDEDTSMGEGSDDSDEE